MRCGISHIHATSVTALARALHLSKAIAGDWAAVKWSSVCTFLQLLLPPSFPYFFPITEAEESHPIPFYSLSSCLTDSPISQTFHPWLVCSFISHIFHGEKKKEKNKKKKKRNTKQRNLIKTSLTVQLLPHFPLLILLKAMSTITFWNGLLQITPLFCWACRSLAIFKFRLSSCLCSLMDIPKRSAFTAIPTFLPMFRSALVLIHHFSVTPSYTSLSSSYLCKSLLSGLLSQAATLTMSPLSSKLFALFLRVFLFFYNKSKQTLKQTNEPTYLS